MTLVVLELKPAEVEFLSSLGRCKLCDHLGVLHHESHEEYEGDVEHCGTCLNEDVEELCYGVSLSAALSTHCMIDGCHCQDFR